ncbi:MAG: ATP synthase subunit I [Firmicutes bacterium]|nr:ATP synthase subunit I [Bacillota bacterium]
MSAGRSPAGTARTGAQGARGAPRAALRWIAVAALASLGTGLAGLAPGVAYGLAAGLGLGAANGLMFLRRLEVAERAGPEAGGRIVRGGVPGRFLFVVAVLWLLQSRWPAVNIVAALIGIFGSWLLFTWVFVRNMPRNRSDAR